jgi:hypothetical protein
MRALLRVLAPLLGIAVATAGVLLVIEVVSAWVLPEQNGGLLVPWSGWLATLASLSWNQSPVPAVVIGVGVAGLLLIIIGAAARRTGVRLQAPKVDTTVTMPPRVLARLVGNRVRESGDVLSASVTASARRVAVSALAWHDAPSDLREVLVGRVRELLDDLPLRRHPRVAVSVRKQEGVR